MNNDSPKKAVLVVLLVAIITSSLVSAAVVILRPIQLENQILDQARNIVRLSGVVSEEDRPTDDDVLAVFRRLDSRIIDLDAAEFTDELDPLTFDQRRAQSDPDLSVSIPVRSDYADLGRRSIYAPAYLVWDDEQVSRIILPINGSGMWSMMYGYIALESDLNTVADAVFYEQNETPGLGDQITRPEWLAQWQGRRIYDERGEIRFAVAPDRVDASSPAASYEVDALTGATVTGDAVTSLMRYWFGPHGYQPALDQMRENTPTRPATVERAE